MIWIPIIVSLLLAMVTVGIFRKMLDVKAALIDREFDRHQRLIESNRRLSERNYDNGNAFQDTLDEHRRSLHNLGHSRAEIEQAQRASAAAIRSLEQRSSAHEARINHCDHAIMALPSAGPLTIRSMHDAIESLRARIDTVAASHNVDGTVISEWRDELRAVTQRNRLDIARMANATSVALELHARALEALEDYLDDSDPDAPHRESKEERQSELFYRINAITRVFTENSHAPDEGNHLAELLEAYLRDYLPYHRRAEVEMDLIAATELQESFAEACQGLMVSGPALQGLPNPVDLDGTLPDPVDLDGNPAFADGHAAAANEEFRQRIMRDLDERIIRDINAVNANGVFSGETGEENVGGITRDTVAEALQSLPARDVSEMPVETVSEILRNGWYDGPRGVDQLRTPANPYAIDSNIDSIEPWSHHLDAGGGDYVLDNVRTARIVADRIVLDARQVIIHNGVLRRTFSDDFDVSTLEGTDLARDVGAEAATDAELNGRTPRGVRFRE